MGQQIKALEQLLHIMEKLRDPQHGCPWDIEQTHQSLRKYVIEEAYEVVEAIDNNDQVELAKELGDLLLQVVFHAQIAKESGRFDFSEIVQNLNKKLISRHPHVFGDAGRRSVEEQNLDWERIKASERLDSGVISALDGVAKSLPALTRAYKLQKRAARVGFDWNEIARVRQKIDEELRELENAEAKDQEGEFGDLLFAMVNFGRHLGIDPESALHMTNKKFTQRFSYIEQSLESRGQTLEDASLEEMEALWQEAKQA